MTIHINRIAEKNMGDFAPEMWADDPHWQQARAVLWDYFRATKSEQFSSPLGTPQFRDFLKAYHTPRRDENTNCFSYACEMFADGVTIEPCLLQYPGIERLLQDEPYEITVTANTHPYHQLAGAMTNNLAAMGNVLHGLDFSDRSETLGIPVIATVSTPRQDFHFLKVLTGSYQGHPRVAFLEQDGAGAGVSYHHSPVHYFSSFDYHLKYDRNYAEPTVFFAPDTVRNLKLSGKRTNDIRDKKLVAYYYKAKASYIP